MTIPSALERQLRDDSDTLRDRTGAIGRLEASLRDGRRAVRVRRRGDFTPDDEDRTRQLLLAYRNYRLALYAIIRRHAASALAETADLQIRRLLVGLPAGLTLDSKSLKLVGLSSIHRWCGGSSTSPTPSSISRPDFSTK